MLVQTILITSFKIGLSTLSSSFITSFFKTVLKLTVLLSVLTWCNHFNTNDAFIRYVSMQARSTVTHMTYINIMSKTTY